MSGTTITGLGTGLDIDGMVTAIADAEKARAEVVFGGIKALTPPPQPAPRSLQSQETAAQERPQWTP